MEAVSVSALTKYLQAKFVRDAHLHHVKLRGELSNVKFHNKGHLYFTLKDEYAKISGVAFSQSLAQMDIDTTVLEDGVEVEIEGSIRVYEVSGTYQIYAMRITPSGIGNLQKQFELLYQNFQERGYFDIQHKKEVPKRIHTLAIVTALDGAAIEDMKKSARNHIPHVQLYLFPTLVQGENAPKLLQSAIQKADRKQCDALIVGRGGGSLEDLWAFNTKEVIEAIYATKTPTISAVGHEVDTMLSDYVADVRALTPTAAIYYFDATQLIESQLSRLISDMQLKVHAQIQSRKHTLQLTVGHLQTRDPKQQIEHQKDTLQINIMRLVAANPQLKMETHQQELNQVSDKLSQLMSATLLHKQSILDSLNQSLNLLNPNSQLKRGYAIVYDDQKLITKISDVQTEFLNIQLSDGQIYVKVVKQSGKSKN